MLEIHLFVNPLGMRCFRCEQDVLRIDQQLRTKVNYQFIPLFNMDTIQQTMKLYHLHHRYYPQFHHAASEPDPHQVLAKLSEY